MHSIRDVVSLCEEVSSALFVNCFRRRGRERSPLAEEEPSQIVRYESCGGGRILIGERKERRSVDDRDRAEEMREQFRRGSVGWIN